MSTALSISVRKVYGVSRVCRVWRMSRSGVYRGLKEGSDNQVPRRRPGPHGQMPDAEPVEEIRKVITASGFYGEGYRKVRARLQHEEIDTSKARVSRLMREKGLLAKRCRGPRRGPRAHDGIIGPSQARGGGRNPGGRISFKSVSITLGRYTGGLAVPNRLLDEEGAQGFVGKSIEERQRARSHTACCFAFSCMAFSRGARQSESHATGGCA